MRSWLSPLFVGLLGLSVLACSGLGKDDDDDDDDEEEEDTGEGEEESNSAREACADLLACLQAVDPVQAESVESTWGAEGTCWDGDARTQEACGAACEQALFAYGMNYPDEPACNGSGDTGDDTSECALATGTYDLELTMTEDDCGIDPVFEGQVYPVEVDCLGETGEFTLVEDNVFVVEMDCAGDGSTFACSYHLDGYDLTWIGAARNQGATAEGQWRLTLDSCGDIVGDFTLVSAD